LVFQWKVYQVRPGSEKLQERQKVFDKI
jgi:hypothetical protein